jgi:hypothetical protein
MILALQGADPNAVRAMQHFISEGAWDDTLIHLVRTKLVG